MAQAPPPLDEHRRPFDKKIQKLLTLNITLSNPKPNTHPNNKRK